MARRLFAGLLSLLLLPLVVVVGLASPAAAATCATSGHVYVITGAGTYLSGYEGDYQFGIPRITLAPGSTFQAGGNGLLPYSNVFFQLYAGDTVPPPGTAVHNLTFIQVGGNCVANQAWVLAPDPSLVGTFQVRAQYVAGNSGSSVQETVVIITFASPPPPPPGGGGGGGGCISRCLL